MISTIASGAGSGILGASLPIIGGVLGALPLFLGPHGPQGILKGMSQDEVNRLIQQRYPGVPLVTAEQQLTQDAQNDPSILQGTGAHVAQAPSIANGNPGGGIFNVPSGQNIPAIPGTVGSTAQPDTSVLGTIAKALGIPTTGGTAGIVGALAKLGIPVTSAIINGHAATSAANAQANADTTAAQLQAGTAQNSLDFAKQIYGDQQTAIAPYQSAGTNALARIQQLEGLTPTTDGSSPTASLTTTPRYQLDYSEGLKALDAASHGVLSGSTIKAAQQFGQGLADKTFNSTIGDLNTTAGFGQTGNSQSLSSGNNVVGQNTNINTNAADNISNLNTNAAMLRASSYGSGVLSSVLKQLQGVA